MAEHWRSVPPREVVIPAVVLYELEAGIEKSANPETRRKGLSDLLMVIRLLPFDEAAARASADIRAQLEKARKAIGR